jgi:hypothetical protein
MRLEPDKCRTRCPLTRWQDCGAIFHGVALLRVLVLSQVARLPDCQAHPPGNLTRHSGNLTNHSGILTSEMASSGTDRTAEMSSF